MAEYGEFCMIYGKTLRNKVLEFMLEMGELDYSVGDVAKDAEISRPKAYQIVSELEKESIVKKTRVMKGTQLYSLNKSDEKVKLLKKSFVECLNIVVDDYAVDPLKELKHVLKGKTMPKGKFLEMKKEIVKWV